MKREVITTADGSKTIRIEEWNEQYHSKHGALQEALHVFIKNGLCFYTKEFIHSANTNISILEIGFGTGLNALLTAIQAEKLQVNIDYVGVEAFPVLSEELNQLNYGEILPENTKEIFKAIHSTEWEKPCHITSNFTLLKRKQIFEDITDQNSYDIIYFDAFGARVQPELWTKEIFEIMFRALHPKGVLVTYAAIGKVKRDMKAIGFEVERLQGPPGKRHMMRAVKP